MLNRLALVLSVLPTRTLGPLPAEEVDSIEMPNTGVSLALAESAGRSVGVRFLVGGTVSVSSTTSCWERLDRPTRLASQSWNRAGSLPKAWGRCTCHYL